MVASSGFWSPVPSDVFVTAGSSCSERGHNRIFLKYHSSQGVSDFFSSAQDVFSVSSQVTKDGKPLRKWTGFAVN